MLGPSPHPEVWRSGGGLGRRSAGLAGLVAAALALPVLVAFPEVIVGYDAVRAVLSTVTLVGFFLLALVPFRFQILAAIVAFPFLTTLDPNQDPFQYNDWIRIAIMATLIFWSVATYIRFASSRTPLPAVRPAIYFVIWAVLLTATNSPDTLGGSTMLMKHALFIPFLWIIPRGLKAGDVKRYVLPFVLLTGLMALLYGYYELARDFGMGERPYGLGGTYRATSVFASTAPNPFGVYLASLIALFGGVVWLGNVSEKRWRVLLAHGLLVASIVLLWMTFSRRAIGALAIAGVLVAALERSRRAWRLVAALLIAGGLAVWLLPSELILNPRVLAILDVQADASVAKRLSSVAVLWDQLGRTWSTALIGTGVGEGALFALLHIGLAVTGPIDAYYVSLVLDFGLGGLLLYVAAVGVPLVYVGRRYHEVAREDRPWVAGLSGAVLVILIAGIAGNTNLTFPISMYLWVFGGCALTLVRERRTSD